MNVEKANIWYKDNKRPKSMLFWCGNCLNRVYDHPKNGQCRYKYCPFCGVGKEITLISYGMPEKEGADNAEKVL